MSYAPPAWLPVEANPNGTILVLDDFSRANPVFLQAVMELIDRGSYMTWSLPKDTTILLTSNPDNGEYNVTSYDSALVSRMIKFHVNFDINDWASWAEMANINSRAINFALAYNTELFQNEDARKGGFNARSYTTFCNLIGHIDDWSSTKSSSLIINLAEGCFNDTNNIIGGLFHQFISRKLDQLIDPETMITGDIEEVCKKIRNNVYENETYNGAIASLLATRLLNGSIKMLKSKGVKESTVCDRIKEILKRCGDSSDRLFSEDLIFNLLKVLINKCPARTKSLLLDPIVRTKILS